MGIQVYASAIIHTAFKVAQGKIARRHGIAPEEISPAKLFPQMAKACRDQATVEATWLETLRLNSGVKLTQA